MQKTLKWLPIAATLWFGCVPASAAASGARTTRRASQTSSTVHSTTTAKKPARKHRHQSQRAHLPKAPTPDRISEIQSALSRAGYFQGDPNGKWDANTVAALQKFQSSNGIDSTGKLDAPTLQKLGLGSDIAGVSAPRPVVPPLASLSPPSSPGSSSSSSSGSSAASR